MNQARARAALEELVPATATAAALAADGCEPLALGSAGGDERAALDAAARFDLASLTKPVIATLALALDAAGELSLELTLGEVWGAAAGERAATRLEDLLRHRARLPAWAPLYRVCAGADEAAAWILSTRRATPAPPGYGDLDYVLWGLTAERALGRRLPRLLGDFVTGPLGLTDLGYTPPPERAVACALDTDREVELAAAMGLEIAPLGPPSAGEPQDGNARFLRGIAAHAGLFGSVVDLWSLLGEWIAPRALFDRKRRDRALAAPERFALGWWPASAWLRAATGRRGVFHHVGFTGGALWVEPAARRRLVLLAHRRGLEIDLRRRREEIHDSF